MSNPIWITSAGSIGTYPALIPISPPFQFSAISIAPATSIKYSLISGSLPSGLSLSDSGLLTGIPDIVTFDTTNNFILRITDDLGNIRDRSFAITITGVAAPSFTTPTGGILNTQDSIWIELPIEYDNPVIDNPVSIRLVQGSLPPGLEINGAGLIRGYPEAPETTINLGVINTSATATTETTNVITCVSTTGFSINRPIIFSGTVFGGITAGQTYYVRSVINETSFTISPTQDGPVYPLITDTGFMGVNLPNISIGQPTIRTYSFVLQLSSPLGNDLESYFITVVNQNLPVAQGGPGKGPNTRVPTIYNTRPPTYDIDLDTENFGYYILPPIGEYPIAGTTYPTDINAYIGRITSDNYFSFKILGHDFDNSALTYQYADLPLGLVGDPVTGWITGTPIVATDTISEFSFSVSAKKSTGSQVSPWINFSFRITNNLEGEIIWLTDSDLGTLFNNSISDKSVNAISDVSLSYRVIEGSLPPNLSLSSNGEIIGKTAFQPTSQLLSQGDSTEFIFTIEAYSPDYSVVSSTKTFILTVLQEYDQPTDNLYIKCSPSFLDRALIDSLLQNDSLIPEQYLYRPDDINFGKANSIIYAHAYGIYASDLNQYIEAITKNHYWRNITLGEIETAVARNDMGEIIYEVVYSRVIDNLVNPEGISISEEIVWPETIDLNQGPWYTSITDIYTSYEYDIPSSNQFIITENDLDLLTEYENPLITENGIPTFYTSLSPGQARILYPNSLENMRTRVGQELGQEFDFRLLPAWMTSQQLDGSTLGFTPAWVICYTLPGFSEIIKDNIDNDWKDFLGRKNTLNQINFKIDRFTVDKSSTYNYDNNLIPSAWTGLPSGSPVPDPIDSKDFYVLFPRKTILPTESQQ